MRIQLQREALSRTIFAKSRSLFSFKQSITAHPTRAQREPLFSDSGEYAAYAQQFERYEQEVHLDVLVAIMHDIFKIYTLHASGLGDADTSRLSADEVHEAKELFHEWVVENNLEDAVVPFQMFAQWFTDLCGVIAACRQQQQAAAFQEEA